MKIVYERKLSANWPKQTLEINQTVFDDLCQGSFLRLFRWLENLVGELSSAELRDDNNNLIAAHNYATNQ